MAQQRTAIEPRTVAVSRLSWTNYRGETGEGLEALRFCWDQAAHLTGECRNCLAGNRVLPASRSQDLVRGTITLPVAARLGEQPCRDNCNQDQMTLRREFCQKYGERLLPGIQRFIAKRTHS